MYGERNNLSFFIYFFLFIAIRIGYYAVTFNGKPVKAIYYRRDKGCIERIIQFK